MGFGDILSKLFKKENEKKIRDRKKEVLLADQRKDESLESTDEEDPESFSGLLDQEIYTEIMGDLYISQELYERAIRVFEKLLENDPENQSLKTKLEGARTHLLSEKTRFQAEAKSTQE
jgi:tetratricopeptide (TPR) repeat protein